jgi:hypothetical protein
MEMRKVTYVTANRHDWIGTAWFAELPNLACGTIVEPDGSDRKYEIVTVWHGAFGTVTAVCMEKGTTR